MLCAYIHASTVAINKYVEKVGVFLDPSVFWSLKVNLPFRYGQSTTVEHKKPKISGKTGKNSSTTKMSGIFYLTQKRFWLIFARSEIGTSTLHYSRWNGSSDQNESRCSIIVFWNGREEKTKSIVPVLQSKFTLHSGSIEITLRKSTKTEKRRWHFRNARNLQYFFRDWGKIGNGLI